MDLSTKQLNLLQTLTQINGVSGYEKEITNFLKKSYSELGYELIYDNLGSIFVHKKGNNNKIKVLIAGHMDEVGFIVREIMENGMIKVAPIGGVNDQTLLAHRVHLQTREGKWIPGSIDAVPPHLLSEAERSVPTKLASMLFDFGFSSKQEAMSNGVYQGAQIVADGPFEVLTSGRRLLAKAFDNRYGLVLGLDILEEIKNQNFDFDIYIGGTVQEEVGTRGAETIAHKIHPDLAIVLDCSPARDSMGDKGALGQLGEGVLLRFYDRSMIAFPELLAFQREACEQTGVRYQYFDSNGGTDAGAIHRQFDGILTLTHCICARNIHTCSSVIDIDDYLAAKKSLLWMLNHINAEQFKLWREARR